MSARRSRSTVEEDQGDDRDDRDDRDEGEDRRMLREGSAILVAAD